MNGRTLYQELPALLQQQKLQQAVAQQAMLNSATPPPNAAQLLMAHGSASEFHNQNPSVQEAAHSTWRWLDAVYSALGTSMRVQLRCHAGSWGRNKLPGSYHRIVVVCYEDSTAV